MILSNDYYLSPNESLITAKRHWAAKLKLVTVPLTIYWDSWVMTFILTKCYREKITREKLKLGLRHIRLNYCIKQREINLKRKEQRRNLKKKRKLADCNYTLVKWFKICMHIYSFEQFLPVFSIYFNTEKLVLPEEKNETAAVSLSVNVTSPLIWKYGNGIIFMWTQPCHVKLILSPFQRLTWSHPEHTPSDWTCLRLISCWWREMGAVRERRGCREKNESHKGNGRYTNKNAHILYITYSLVAVFKYVFKYACRESTI